MEGCIRLLPAAILWFAGVTDPVAYGLRLAIPPVLASALVAPGPTRSRRARPAIAVVELSTNLGYLLSGSVLAQSLSYANPDRDRPRHQFAACGGRGVRLRFFLARALIIPFQAVQQRCSRSSRPAGAGEHEDFKNGLRKLVLIVIGVGVIGVVGVSCSVPGPCSSSSTRTSAAASLAMLAAGSGAFILALTLAQALIALMGHAKATVSGDWHRGRRDRWSRCPASASSCSSAWSLSSSPASGARR